MANNVSGALDSLLTTGLSFYAPFADKGNGEVSLVAAGAGDTTPTFTRATDATTVDENGLIVTVTSGTPRSYYDPTTLEYRGYLAEGARTNRCLYSEQLDNAAWTPTGLTVGANTTVAPDGTTTADTLTEDTGSSSHRVVPTNAVVVSSGATVTFSVFLKAGSRRYVCVGVGNGTNSFYAVVDTQSWTIGEAQAQNSATYTGSSLKAYPNGWYLVSVVGAITAQTNYFQTVAGSDTATPGTRNPTYTGTSSTIIAWGAQLEAGTFPSTYIPTEGSAVTRNADVLTYPFSGNADATVGTIYAEISTNWAVDAAIAHAYVSFAAGPTGLLSSSNRAATIINGFDGSNLAQKSGLSSMNTGVRKRGLSYGGSTQEVTGDGASVASGTFDGNIGSTAIGIGCSGAGANQSDGTIKNVRIWKNQFTAAQLQAITSG